MEKKFGSGFGRKWVWLFFYFYFEDNKVAVRPIMLQTRVGSGLKIKSGSTHNPLPQKTDPKPSESRPLEASACPPTYPTSLLPPISGGRTTAATSDGIRRRVRRRGWYRSDSITYELLDLPSTTTPSQVSHGMEVAIVDARRCLCFTSTTREWSLKK